MYQVVPVGCHSGNYVNHLLTTMTLTFAGYCGTLHKLCLSIGTASQLVIVPICKAWQEEGFKCFRQSTRLITYSKA